MLIGLKKTEKRLKKLRKILIIMNKMSFSHKVEEMKRSMDGWMNGWMDGRMDGWMDGWMNGWMDRWMDR